MKALLEAVLLYIDQSLYIYDLAFIKFQGFICYQTNDPTESNEKINCEEDWRYLKTDES